MLGNNHGLEYGQEAVIITQLIVIDINEKRNKPR
jgi:hypothetical protein